MERKASAERSILITVKKMPARTKRTEDGRDTMRGKIYQIFSMFLAAVILFTSVDMTAFASQAMPENIVVQEPEEPFAEGTFEVTEEPVAPSDEGLTQAPAAQDPTAEPSEEPTEEPAYEPTEEPVADPTAEPETDSLENGLSEETCVVTFDAMGGLCDVTEMEVVLGEPYGTLPEASRANYDFDGWFTDPEEGEQITEESIVELIEQLAAEELNEENGGPKETEAVELAEDLLDEEIAGVTLYAHWSCKDKASKPKTNAGNFINLYPGTQIVLTTDTRDAKIYYTFDDAIGENVCAENGILFDEFIELEQSGTLYAVAVKEHYENSDVLIYPITVQDDADRWEDVTEEDRLIMGFETADDVPKDLWLVGVTDAVYTGEKITFPEIRVYHNRKLLKDGEEYTVKYSKNTNAGTATVTVTGKGFYSGSIVQQFEISPLNISAGSAEDVTLTYNGKVQKGKTKVTFSLGGKEIVLEEGVDYTILYPGTDSTLEDYDENAFKEVSDIAYTAVVQGKGNYEGSITFGQTIIERTLISKVTAGEVSAKKYTGKDICPKVTLTYKKKTLKEGVDYTLSYENNVNTGTATILVTGIGIYTGEKTVNFKITGTSLSTASFAEWKASVKYDGTGKTQPEAYLYVGKKTNKLTENKDYTVSYKNNVNIGTATVTYKGIGAYSGSVKKTFKITGTALADVKIAKIPSVPYEVTARKPVPTVTYKGAPVPGIEKSAYDALSDEEKAAYGYVYIYSKNVKPGTATIKLSGVNNFSGTVTKTFTITKWDIRTGSRFVTPDAATDEKYLVTYPAEIPYTKGGVTKKPDVSFEKDGGGSVCLKEGVDYTVTIKNGKKPGTATLVITGKGNFTGTISNTFKITPADLSDATIASSDMVYQKKSGNFKKTLVLTDTNKKKLEAGVDYEKKMAYTYETDALVQQFTDAKKKKTTSLIRRKGEVVQNADIVPVGTLIKVTITGKGYYKDTVKEEIYKIAKADISKAEITVKKLAYEGSWQTRPTKDLITIQLGKTVLEKEDYQIVAYNGPSAPEGKGWIDLQGVGNYGGTKRVTYQFKSRSMNYQIVYDKNAEGVSGTMKNSSIPYGGTLRENVYKRTGYTFAGWSTTPDGAGGKTFVNKGKYLPIFDRPVFGSEVILYAQWKPIVYTVTYKLNGGENHEENIKSYTIEDALFELLEPTREGYEFRGWYTDSKFTSSKKITSLAGGKTGNKTLYAKWKATVIAPVPAPAPENCLNVLDFGAIPGDGIDDATAFEDAIKQASANADNGGINTVYAPAGTYDIRPGDANNDGEPGICLKSNVNLVMDNKAILKAMGSSYASYCVISAKYASNITITGGQIAGERSRHKGSGGEAGHGIALFAASNVTISNMSISANWGDGIYLGTQKVRQPDDSQKSVGCKNIDIINCEIFENRRSNISIVDADDVLVDNCLIYAAHGTAPQCGINIEPNSDASGDKICRNITVQNTTITPYQNKTNDPAYICFMTHYNPYNPNYVTGDNILLKNCTINGYVGNYSGTNFRLQNTKIKGPYVNLR
ncbi:MAG: InlB B-repeat-containing protein [Lachnospiraceae bacterium]|nr:InlB B-repeat-containing protein [Lachnospiraceae bacterium]